MNVRPLRTASALTLVGTALSVSANTSFYGGDFDANDAVITELMDNSETYARVFDDFTVSEATAVQQIYGNFVGEYLEDGGTDHMYYEIRQGVQDGDGGVLLYSGLLDTIAQYVGEVPTSAITNYDQYYRVSANVGPDVILAPGTYFLGLSVSPLTYLMTTSHENASGGFIDNDLSYFDSVNYNRPPFQDLDETGNQGATDLSMGMTGRPAPVPEPATLAALGLGAAALLRRRKRS